jgi:hypothetical protein
MEWRRLSLLTKHFSEYFLALGFDGVFISLQVCIFPAKLCRSQPDFLKDLGCGVGTLDLSSSKKKPLTTSLRCALGSLGTFVGQNLSKFCSRETAIDCVENSI